MAKANKTEIIADETVIETPAQETPQAEAATTKTTDKKEVELKIGQCICHPKDKPNKEIITSIANYNSLYKAQGWVLVTEKKTSSSAAKAPITG